MSDSDRSLADSVIYGGVQPFCPPGSQAPATAECFQGFEITPKMNDRVGCSAIRSPSTGLRIQMKPKAAG
ncbi:hypothetical protein J6590_049602 [Homalodisca vitripennis]|nr:hypothetical protein J6590_049602 [Homalodisca vitripennis]